MGLGGAGLGWWTGAGLSSLLPCAPFNEQRAVVMRHCLVLTQGGALVRWEQAPTHPLAHPPTHPPAHLAACLAPPATIRREESERDD